MQEIVKSQEDQPTLENLERRRCLNRHLDKQLARRDAFGGKSLGSCGFLKGIGIPNSSTYQQSLGGKETI